MAQSERRTRTKKEIHATIPYGADECGSVPYGGADEGGEAPYNLRCCRTGRRTGHRSRAARRRRRRRTCVVAGCGHSLTNESKDECV